MAEGPGGFTTQGPRPAPPCFQSSLSSLSCPSRLILRIQIPHENTPHPWLTLMEFLPTLAT